MMVTNQHTQWVSIIAENGHKVVDTLLSAAVMLVLATLSASPALLLFDQNWSDVD